MLVVCVIVIYIQSILGTCWGLVPRYLNGCRIVDRELLSLWDKWGIMPIKVSDSPGLGEGASRKSAAN